MSKEDINKKAVYFLTAILDKCNHADDLMDFYKVSADNIPTEYSELVIDWLEQIIKSYIRGEGYKFCFADDIIGLEDSIAISTNIFKNSKEFFENIKEYLTETNHSILAYYQYRNKLIINHNEYFNKDISIANMCIETAGLLDEYINNIK